MKKSIAILTLAACALSAQVFAVVSETQPENNRSNQDYQRGKQAVAARDWQAAVDALNKAARSEPRSADIHNLLGYSYRHLNQLELSFKHYDEALAIDPGHRGAHEYIGQAYLMSGKLAKAEEHLARLEKLCDKKCEEYADLAKAIADYKKKNP